MNVVFSVIMVTYFHENYLDKAINSVLKQSLANKIEILIGDDGSEDNTVELLREYEKKYSFIHVYAHENQGLSKNLYDLLIKAKGDYIAILEADDYWTDNEKLEKQLSILQGHNCVGTCCNCIKKDNDGNELGLWNNWSFSRILTKSEILMYQTYVCHPSGLAMKNIFKNSGEKYKVIRDASRMGGNHTGMINLLSSKGGLYYDPRPMFVWRVVQVAGAKNYSSQKVNKPMNYYENMKKYEMYDRELDYNYEKHIMQQYRACKKSMKKELVDCVGQRRYYLGLLKCVISKFTIKFRWKN